MSRNRYRNRNRNLNRNRNRNRNRLKSSQDSHLRLATAVNIHRNDQSSPFDKLRAATRLAGFGEYLRPEFLRPRDIRL